MFRKIVCILSAAGVLAVTGIPARATRRLGSLCVIPAWCETEISGGYVTVHPVGEPVSGGYALTDGLADWIVWEDELDSELVLHLAEQKQLRDGLTGQVTPEKGAIFPELEAGLYLVSQTEAAEGYSAFSPFLVSIPAGDMWDLTMRPDVILLGESPRTGDRPAPIVAAMGISFSVAMLMILVDKHKK